MSDPPPDPVSLSLEKGLTLAEMNSSRSSSPPFRAAININHFNPNQASHPIYTKTGALILYQEPSTSNSKAKG